MGVSGQRHAPAALHWKRPGTLFVGDWVGPRVSEIVFRDVPIKYDCAVNVKRRRLKTECSRFLLCFSCHKTGWYLPCEFKSKLRHSLIQLGLILCNKVHGRVLMKHSVKSIQLIH
jgi:hypothetical protein